jgi:hypothetical protein
MSGLTERSLAKRILFFSSVGIVSGMAGEQLQGTAGIAAQPHQRPAEHGCCGAELLACRCA